MKQVRENKSSGSDDNNVSAAGVPAFKIGSQVGGVLHSDPTKEQADHHQSILDIDIPDAGQRDVAEAPDMIRRQESFLTEVEEFQNTEKTETVVASSELETQLRPVFNLCQPNSDGLISIEHLRAMCREHGQVKYLISRHNTL